MPKKERNNPYRGRVDSWGIPRGVEEISDKPRKTRKIGAKAKAVTLAKESTHARS